MHKRIKTINGIHIDDHPEFILVQPKVFSDARGFFIETFQAKEFEKDGMKNSPYEEGGRPLPLNVYGKTKLTGERAIQEIGGAYLILRTSWVYGMRGKIFLLTMRRLAREKDELRVVNDQVGASTWCRSIAAMTGS